MARSKVGQRGFGKLILWVLAAGIVAGFVTAIFIKQNNSEILRTSHASNQKGKFQSTRSELEAEGEDIRKQLQDWTRRAHENGVDVHSVLQDSGSLMYSKEKPKNDPDTCTPLLITPQTAEIEGDPELRSILSSVANEKNEVMIALANGVMICRNTTICWWNGGNILQSWLEVTVGRHRISNLALGILDDETWSYMDAHWPQVKKFRPKANIPDSQAGTHPANRVSTLKYGLLTEVLQMGYSVLIADMDLVFLEDPFLHLYRDSDIESQTDGFSAHWSYGYLGSIHDPTMGWGAGGLYVQTFTLNVGLLYVRPTARSIDLMLRVSKRLLNEKGWDQQIFNEETLFAAHGEVSRAQVSVRVMDYLLFANSKTFFRSERQRFFPGNKAHKKPLMVHMNYHPDKHVRMLCIMARYFEGKLDACDRLPSGSELGT